MSRGAIDIEKLRGTLRRLNRGNLLMMAERAIEIVLRAKLPALVGDMVRLDELAEGKRGAAPLFDEVWRLPPAMTWSAQGWKPWMRYPAVSFAAAVRPLLSRASNSGGGIAT